jgi:hypothetical protein
MPELARRVLRPRYFRRLEVQRLWRDGYSVTGRTNERRKQDLRSKVTAHPARPEPIATNARDGPGNVNIRGDLIAACELIGDRGKPAAPIADPCRDSTAGGRQARLDEAGRMQTHGVAR